MFTFCKESWLGLKKQDFWPKKQHTQRKFVNPSADSLSKLGMVLENRMVQKLKLSKNDFDKTCAPKLLLFIEKKSERFD